MFAQSSNYLLSIQYIKSIELTTMLVENEVTPVCIVQTHDCTTKQIIGEDAIAFFNSAKSKIVEMELNHG